MKEWIIQLFCCHKYNRGTLIRIKSTGGLSNNYGGLDRDTIWECEKCGKIRTYYYGI